MDSILHQLALEYLKATTDLKTLKVEDFYTKYNEILYTLYELKSEENSTISREALNKFLKS